MIKLIHGDCLVHMRRLESNSVDMVLCDPPYGTTDCYWDNLIPFGAMWSRLNGLCKNNSPILLFGAEPFSSKLRMSNIKNYRYDWYWRKNKVTGFPNANRQPLRNFELISVFYKKQANFQPQGLIKRKKPRRMQREQASNGNESFASGVNDGSLCKQYQSEYLNYPNQLLSFKSPVKPVHPTEKPVGILEYLIKTYTKEGDTVLDFTMGSGSTGVACKNLNRNFIGIEKEEKYYKIACERMGVEP